MNVGRALGLVESVASLVRLPQSVDDEHDEEDDAEQAHHRAPYNSCNMTQVALHTFAMLIQSCFPLKL